MPIEVGDYLCYHTLRGEPLDPKMWVQVIAVTPDQGRARLILKGSADYAYKVITFDIAATPNNADRTTVKQADLPDEVYVEIARRALLGLTN